MMTMINYYLIVLTLLATFQREYAFEISSYHDQIWAYINVTCETQPAKDEIKHKAKDFRNLYYDFENFRLSRSISSKNSQLFEIEDKRNQDLHKSSKHFDRSRINHGILDDRVQLDGNIISGSQRVFLYSDCDLIIFKQGAASDIVNSLFVNSDGSIVLEKGWFGSNITVLKIYSKNMKFSNNCTWLPPSISQLDIDGVILNTTDLSLCRSNIKTLSLVDASLNEIKFCFNMLESLDLSSNSLQSVDFSDKCGNNIREFKASNNNIREWSSCGLPNLVHLSIDHNFLTKIDLSSCSSDNLFRIDASHNKINQFPIVLPERLSSLVLSFNKIENISAIESSFKILDLSHNIIRRLVKGAFRLAWELSELNLSHNLLSAIHNHDFSGLRQLNHLDLSHNIIQKIRSKAFSSLVNLKALHLNGNNLHTLDTRLLAYLPKPIKLIVHGNPWSCSCYLLAQLSKITRSTCAPKCPKQSKLKCKQGRTWLTSTFILKKCIAAVQSNRNDFTYPLTPESDEDTSEEKTGLPLLPQNSGIILILFLVLGAITIKTYTERKWVRKNLCNCLEPSSAIDAKTGHRLTAIGTPTLPESESETEL